MRREHDGRERRLAEVKLAGQVTGESFAHIMARIGAAVRGGVQPFASEKVVLDEAQVAVVAERVVIDVARAGEGTDHEPRDAYAIASFVHARRHDVVVEATPIIPGHEDRRRAPAGASHDGVDQGGYVSLTSGRSSGWVF